MFVVWFSICLVRNLPENPTVGRILTLKPSFLFLVFFVFLFFLVRKRRLTVTATQVAPKVAAPDSARNSSVMYRSEEIGTAPDVLPLPFPDAKVCVRVNDTIRAGLA